MFIQYAIILLFCVLLQFFSQEYYLLTLEGVDNLASLAKVSLKCAYKQAFLYQHNCIVLAYTSIIYFNYLMLEDIIICNRYPFNIY